MPSLQPERRTGNDTFNCDGNESDEQDWKARLIECPDFSGGVHYSIYIGPAITLEKVQKESGQRGGVGPFSPPP